MHTRVARYEAAAQRTRLLKAATRRRARQFGIGGRGADTRRRTVAPQRRRRRPEALCKALNKTTLQLSVINRCEPGWWRHISRDGGRPPDRRDRKKLWMCFASIVTRPGTPCIPAHESLQNRGESMLSCAEPSVPARLQTGV